MATDTAAKTEEAAAPAKKSKMMLFIIIGAVLLLGGGGAGGYFLFAPAGPPPPPEPGAVVVLESMTLNLADGHFLKVAIALQATAEVAAEPDGSKARDIMISTLSNMKPAELATNKAREHVKAELKEKIVKAYEVEQVKQIMDIYFTEFVMQ